MSIKTEQVRISGAGGEYGGYLAVPEGRKSAPGIVVIQEIFGVNAHMKDVTERFAHNGYVALAPDIFWRTEPGLELGYTPDDIARGREIKGGLDTDALVEDIKGAFATLRARPECQGRKVGITGYCFGGFVAYLAACRLDPDASSAFYGGGIGASLDEAGGISTPIQFHFGAVDPGIPMSEIDQIKAKVAGKSDAEVFVYDDADHGFHCDHRGSYQQKAAHTAYARTLSLFAEHLV